MISDSWASLHISMDVLSANIISAIGGLEQLTQLIVYAEEAQGLTKLSRLRHASEIMLSVGAIAPEAFQAIATLPELQRLTVSSAGVTSESLIAISRSPGLQYLSVNDDRPLAYEDLIQLSTITTLRTVVATFTTTHDRKRLARNVPTVNWVVAKR